MIYTDRFLKALGAWQRGWKEDVALRLPIAEELVAAIDNLPSPLPKRSPPPHCYRKRFLRAHNPQNDREMTDLILGEGIHDGVASWTTDSQLWRSFKEPFRDGCITALFEYRPDDHEVVVDIPELWKDTDFIAALAAYDERAGLHGNALRGYNVSQSELILRAPLTFDGICGFTGPIGTYDELYIEAGTQTEEAQDTLWDALTKAGFYPGQAYWVERESAQRILKSTLETLDRRVSDIGG